MVFSAWYIALWYCIIWYSSIVLSKNLKITDFTKKTNLKRTLSFEWRSSYREEHGHHRLPVRIRQSMCQSLVLVESSFLPSVKEHKGVVRTDPKNDEHCQHVEHAEKPTNVKCNTLTCRKTCEQNMQHIKDVTRPKICK